MKNPKRILTLHKEINNGKYNKFIPTKSLLDITELYIIRRDGWRRR